MFVSDHGVVHGESGEDVCVYLMCFPEEETGFGTIQVNALSLRIFHSVITVAQSLSRVFGGIARIVLRKCLWISVILVQTGRCFLHFRS